MARSAGASARLLPRRNARKLTASRKATYTFTFGIVTIERDIMRRYRLLLIGLLVAAVAIPAAGRAQTQDDQPTQSIETLEVFLPIMVFDKKGNFVPNLRRENFHVYEDGKEQEIKSFEAPTQLPLDIGILLDTSASVKRKLKFEQDAASAFI